MMPRVSEISRPDQDAGEHVVAFLRDHLPGRLAVGAVRMVGVGVPPVPRGAHVGADRAEVPGHLPVEDADSFSPAGQVGRVQEHVDQVGGIPARSFNNWSD